jgi:hypothetical protein
MTTELALISHMVGQKEWWIVANPIWQEPHSELCRQDSRKLAG